MKRPSNGWKPGQSGNPSGRKPGSGPTQQLREALGKDVELIINKVREQALAGDLSAAKLVLERLLPPLRQQEEPVCLELPQGSLTEAGRAILESVACGAIPPTQGATLVGALGQLARVAEVDELTRRIEELEAKHEHAGSTGR